MPSEEDNLLGSPALPGLHPPTPQGERHSTIRVLLVDDHAMLRQSLRGIIDACSYMEVVGEAGDGLEAIEAMPVLRPDVVVMDIDMPRMNGIEATKRIKAAFPSTAIIGLSVHLAGNIIQQMRAAGICSYLTKESVVETLRQAIEEAASFRGWSRI
jgi:DNA-binding NarL/FixJ family response regulator